MRSEVKKKYYTLIRNHGKLLARHRALELAHEDMLTRLAALYVTMRKVITLVPYDDPCVTAARSMLDNVSTDVESHMEHSHTVALEHAEG